MSVPAPAIDRRSYQDIVDETVARIAVHNPEWTNHNESDPGITILELFAFIAESVIYRANRVPDRNRQKFLELLGVPLSPASSAQGIVTISNDRGPAATVTIDPDLEVRAGAVSFRTTLGLDVLPIEGRVFSKQTVEAPDRLIKYYQQLYASYDGLKPKLEDLTLYETVPLDGQSSDGISLQSTADGSLWIALLLRAGDADTSDLAKDALRRELAGRTLNIGVVPILTDPTAQLTPTARTGRVDPSSQLDAYLPYTPDGLLPEDTAKRQPQYRKQTLNWQNDVLSRAGVLQLTLPSWQELRIWTNLDPLEPGVGDFPPSLEDSKLDARVVTWIRLQAAKGGKADVLWAGVNATTVTQRTRVLGESLPAGTGEPGQSVQLANKPLIPESIRLTVTEKVAGVDTETVWTRIDDLLAAGPEVPVPDLRAAPGTPPPPAADPNVYVVDPAAGRIDFGDGERGRRPPNGALMRAAYDYGSGQAGNVGRAAIAQSPALPAGFTVTNPVRTWGGADAETVAEGEKQAARYLQHRDRLVSTEDFESIVWRTPGIDLGRIEVLPTYNPELQSDPGDAAGAVTVLVVPRVDPAQPDAPEPDQPFLDAICDFLDPRRLVTTEIFLRGPTYRPIWVTIGIDIVAGPSTDASVAVVRERVKAALRRFLAPIDPDAPPWWEDAPPSVDAPFVHVERGWPLGKAVSALELAAVTNKVDGVLLVRGVKLAVDTSPAVADGGSIPFSGLELPRLMGIDVAVGDPPDLEALRKDATPPPSSDPPTSFPVPVIPDDC